MLDKVERFLGAYEKAVRRVEGSAEKAGSPEPGFLDGGDLDFKPLSKFALVARDLGQDDLEDLYYDTEGLLPERVRDSYATLKYLVLSLFSGSRPPNVSTALKGSKSVPGKVLLSARSVQRWVRATHEWLAETRKALAAAEKETSRAGNWK